MIDLDVHLEAIRLGDAGAFGRFIAGAERAVRESVRPLAMHVDSEAVVQETFLRVWQVAPRIENDGRPNSLLRFAVRVAKNLALDEVRRARIKSVDPAVLADAPDPTPVAPPDPILRRAILECQEALPQKPSLALRARIESGGSDTDEALASQLGMTKNTFLQNFTRARKLLGECLEKKGVAL